MKNEPKIIAHRGSWQTNPPITENSLRSLQNAQNLNIDGTEFDVRMSKDGVLLIHHDEHHGGMEISETNFSELEKLKLDNSENIPALKHYLEKAKEKSSLKLMIELKPLKSQVMENEVVTKAIQQVKESQLEFQIEFISFSLNFCSQIKKEEPVFKVHYLNGDLSPLEVKEKGFDGLDYHYSIFLKNPTWISEAKNLGLITNSWTVNTIEIFKELRKQGIDCITTDVPQLFSNIK